MEKIKPSRCTPLRFHPSRRPTRPPPCPAPSPSRASFTCYLRASVGARMRLEWVLSWQMAMEKILRGAWVPPLEECACHDKHLKQHLKEMFPPREGGLLRRLGARSRCFCCLDPIPPLRGGARKCRWWWRRRRRRWRRRWWWWCVVDGELAFGANKPSAPPMPNTKGKRLGQHVYIGRVIQGKRGGRYACVRRV